MIISRHNLYVVDITKKDNQIPALDNIHIKKDGSSVAIGGRIMMVVSPVKEKTKSQIKNFLPETNEDDFEFTVNADSIKKILQNISTDKKFGGLLEHLNIKKEQGHNCSFKFTDGKRDSNMSAKLYRRAYLPHEELIGKSFETCAKDKPDGMRLVVNLKRLLLLLTAIEKAAPDTSGHNPVWLEFTTDGYIIIRALNMINGQRVMGIMSPLPGNEGKWLELGPWENGFVQKKRTLMHKVKKRKLMHKIKS